MLLAIDIGNTNIVFGISFSGKWQKIWRIQTDPGKTADEYEVIFRSLLSTENISSSQISEVIISSVVPFLSEAFLKMTKNLFPVDPFLVCPEIYSKLPLKILNPHEIGTDLVANATAAFVMYHSPCMIIDFGTALTFTTIGSEGEILGVAIAPGLKTAVKSLASDTAQLPYIRLTLPPSVLGDNTVHAIQAGIVHGYCGLVNHIIEMTRKEMGLNLKTIATGGLAEIIAPLTKSIDCTEKNLTLDGLKIIAELTAN